MGKRDKMLSCDRCGKEMRSDVIKRHQKSRYCNVNLNKVETNNPTSFVVSGKITKKYKERKKPIINTNNVLA